MSTPSTLLADAVRQHGSPLWAYDAQTIGQRIDQLLQHFDTVRFAQKARSEEHTSELSHLKLSRMPSSA